MAGRRKRSWKRRKTSQSSTNGAGEERECLDREEKAEISNSAMQGGRWIHLRGELRERQEGSSERLDFVYYSIHAVSFPEILPFALERINPTTHISSDCRQQFLSLLFVSFPENRNLFSHSAFRQLMKYCTEVLPCLAQWDMFMFMFKQRAG